MEIYIFYLLLGIVLVSVELFVLQLTTFWTLFVGIAAMITGMTAYFKPDISWTAATALFVIVTIVQILLLLRPLKKWRQQPSPMQGNDAIGQTAEVLEPVLPDKPGMVNWSGSKWKARLEKGATPLQTGDMATIVALDGLILEVAPQSNNQ